MYIQLPVLKNGSKNKSQEITKSHETWNNLDYKLKELQIKILRLKDTRKWSGELTTNIISKKIM